MMDNINLLPCKINNEIIEVVKSYTYLGHIITNNLSDDLDILNQSRKFFPKANLILRKFFMCSIEVKVTLFKSYCTSIYMAHLWTNYSQNNFNKLYIAYHNPLLNYLLEYQKESIQDQSV